MAEIICPNCGRRNAEAARYCAACGINLGDAAPKDAHGRPQYETAGKRSIWKRIKQILNRQDAKNTKM